MFLCVCLSCLKEVCLLGNDFCAVFFLVHFVWKELGEWQIYRCRRLGLLSPTSKPGPVLLKIAAAPLNLTCEMSCWPTNLYISDELNFMKESERRSVICR